MATHIPALALAAGLSVLGGEEAELPELGLGAEAQGRLNNEDTPEISYHVQAVRRCGVYELYLTMLEGGLPSATLGADGEEYEIRLGPETLARGSRRLTLEAGSYTLTVENENELAALSYKLRLSFVGPWDETMEWEPNDAGARQFLKIGKPVKGSLDGVDEDCFGFDVPAKAAESYDVLLKTESGHRLLLLVGRAGSQAWRVGAPCDGGYSVAGARLDAGSHEIRVSRAPGCLRQGPENIAAFLAGLPSVEYTVEARRADKALQTLCPGSAPSGADKAAARGKIEKEVFEAEMEHICGILGPRVGRPDLAAMPRLFDDGMPEAGRRRMRNTADSVGKLSDSALSGAQVVEACRTHVNRAGAVSVEQACAFAALWTGWDRVPDEWAAELLDGPAARAMRAAIGKTDWVLSARAVSPAGLLVAATGEPGGLWQGGRRAWRLWAADKSGNAADGPVFFDKESGLWLAEVATPVMDGTNVVGALLVTSVVGR